MTKETPNSDLCFEQDFHEDSPEELWRLSAMRSYHNGEIRHVNWFASETAALAHRDWINAGRGRVLSITKYRACEQR